MNDRIPYSYTTLRYVHDSTTGEFVNVGVVVYAPTEAFLGARMRRRYSRLTHFFPNVEGGALVQTLKIIERSMAAAAKRMDKKGAEDLFKVMEKDVLSLATQYVPLDDSSLQWAPIRGGLASDLNATLDRLFDRLVDRYDEHSLKTSRTDAEVWREFSKVLEVRRLDDQVTEHSVKSSIDTVTFDRALKNGKWHLLEPISFDLLDGATIKRKAQQIAGQMMILQDAKEDFDVYLLVGEPKNPLVKKEYEVALKTLDTIPVAKRVFTESEVASFGQAIDKAMSHQ